MVRHSSLAARRGRTRRNGFTLIELLVVIAIIAVLAALFMPALKQAVSTAKRVACASNMHQFGIAIHRYASDNQGFMPPIWQRGWNDPPDRNLGSRGRGYTLFGVLRESGDLPPEIMRCPADPRAYTPTEETFHQPAYALGEDYSQPYDHRYSYGALMIGYNLGGRRLPWSVPRGRSEATAAYAGPVGFDEFPNPTTLHLIWDAHIPIFTFYGGVYQLISWPEGWPPGLAEQTSFRHAQNEWVDWSQGPNSLIADGHVEQWVDYAYIRAHPAESEDLFNIPYNR